LPVFVRMTLFRNTTLWFYSDRAWSVFLVEPVTRSIVRYLASCKLKATRKRHRKIRLLNSRISLSFRPSAPSLCFSIFLDCLSRVTLFIRSTEQKPFTRINIVYVNIGCPSVTYGLVWAALPHFSSNSISLSNLNVVFLEQPIAHHAAAGCREKKIRKNMVRLSRSPLSF